MKTILVAIDFSNASRNASVYAAELAKISGAKLLLYHAYVVEVGIIDQEKEGQRSKQRLKDEATLLNKMTGVEINCLITEGTAAKEIIALEKKECPDLVILGMKEAEATSKFIFGSVATVIIKETYVPVIIVPECAKFKKIDRIAFATDFIMEKEVPMHEPVKNLLRIFCSKIFILNIVKENEKIRIDDGISGKNIEKYFENIEHCYYFLQDNDLIHGLKDFISCNKIDMMTMMPHEHYLWEKIFTESKTEKMAFNTNIPLLILTS